MTQTIALLVDAYRELNAKKLFWVVLILSTLVALSFLGIGIDAQGISVFGAKWRGWLTTDLIERGDFYRMLYVSLGIGFWLTFIAAALALVSTASIFPDLLTSGSVDLYLSKPISRLRLFLTKYACGLLFVLLQVLAFSAASFVVLGVRGGVWVPGVFIAVPVVLVFFSYLYCVCVLIGVVTRSTIAALLLTILFWTVLWGIHSAEFGALYNETENRMAIARFDRAVAQREAEIKEVDAQLAAPDVDENSARYLQAKKTIAAQKRQEAADRRDRVAANLRGSWHPALYAVKTVLPKTSETVALLNRWVVKMVDPRGASDVYNSSSDESMPRGLLGPPGPDRERVKEELEAVVNARSVAWVAGTSLAFVAVVTGAAAWVFCRRDY